MLWERPMWLLLPHCRLWMALTHRLTYWCSWCLILGYHQPKVDYPIPSLLLGWAAKEIIWPRASCNIYLNNIINGKTLCMWAVTSVIPAVYRGMVMGWLRASQAYAGTTNNTAPKFSLDYELVSGHRWQHRVCSFIKTRWDGHYMAKRSFDCYCLFKTHNNYLSVKFDSHSYTLR